MVRSSITAFFLTILGNLYGSSASAFTLTSPDFQPNSSVPSKYTCEGESETTPPSLLWSNVPAGTKSFALIVDDPDAPNGVWTHWVVFNIPGVSRGWPIADKTLETTIVEGQNSWDETGYRGPCPPSGQHRYFFTLYALDTSLGLSKGASALEVRTAAQSHILGEAQLIGLYKKIK